MDVRNALINEIVEQHKLRIIDGKWVCSCGDHPLGTPGSIEDKDREMTALGMVYGAHLLHRAIDALRDALG
jgi:hypothetical protein